MDGPNKTLRNRFELLPTDDDNDDDDNAVVIVIAAANAFVSACETRWNSYNDQQNAVVDSKGVVVVSRIEATLLYRFQMLRHSR
jgi:hypothetical protein